MLITLSPAKKLNLDPAAAAIPHTLPEQLDDSALLIERLRGFSQTGLQDLMSISAPLAEANFTRFEQWRPPFTTANAKQALLMFQGDVYVGLDAASMDGDDLAFAQKHLRILSGLYGVLRPLDLIQAYRLEMGTRLTNARGRNLYAFWGDAISERLNRDLAAQGDAVLVNLASIEYFKSVRPKRLQGRIITPAFKENRGGKWRVIGTIAKKLRGAMTRYVIRNRLTEVEALKDFEHDGYAFNAGRTDGDEWVFTRG